MQHGFKPGMTRQRTTLALAVIFGLAAPAASWAGSFALPTDNAAGWARANAGGSLFPDDPTAALNNPAAMAFFSGAALQATGTEIRPQANFVGQTLDASGKPTSGSNPSGFGKFKGFPNLAYVTPINDRFAIGASLAVPFGLESKYNSTWQGRYFGTETDLQSIAASLSGAFKVNDAFSMGLGVSVQRTKAQLDTMLDPPGSAVALGIPLTPQADDEQLNVTVKKKFAFGYFGGFVFKPTAQDTLGVSYHSRVQQTLSGSYALYGGAAGKALLGLAPKIDPSLPNINTDGASASAELNTPAYASADYLHQFTDRFSLAGTIKWTNWASFQNLALISNGQELVALNEDNKNTFMYGIGGDYKLTSLLTLHAGIGYDETPTVVASRDPRVPDGNRRLLGFGFGYQATQHVNLDLGYQHQFVSNTSIHNTNPIALGAGTMNGYFEDSGDVVSLSGTYHF